jgi:hypothetical protein
MKILRYRLLDVLLVLAVAAVILLVVSCRMELW